MMAYGIIVGQTMPKVRCCALRNRLSLGSNTCCSQVFNVMFGNSFLDDPRAVVAIFTFTVMMPLSMLKVRARGKGLGLSYCGASALWLRPLPMTPGYPTMQKLESLAKWSGLALLGVAVLILITCIEGNLLPHAPARGNVNAFFQPRFVQVRTARRLIA